jgi:hypothetical protein
MKRAFLIAAVACGVACAAANEKSEGTSGKDAGSGLSAEVGGGTGPTDLDAGASTQPTISPDAACLTSTNSAKAKPASLLFQLDVSGSMNCPATDTASASCTASASSRWSVFRSKLEATLATLPDQNSAGLMHYPTGSGIFSGQPTGCIPQAPDVAVGPLATTRGQIGTSLDARTPVGGTPTHDAVSVALAQLQKVPATTGNRFLVIATDGNATFCAGCNLSCGSAELATDGDAMVAEVAAAAKAGIRTFVIGVPGSQGFRSILSRLATAGGTKVSPSCSDAGPNYCHYDMTTAADFGVALQAALASIGGAALSCTYDIPKSDGSFDPGLVNVDISSGGKETQVGRDPKRTNGWDYSDDGTQIVLYGPACDEAKGTTDGAVTILYGCKTVIQ